MEITIWLYMGWYSQQMRNRINDDNIGRLPKKQMLNPANIYLTPENKEVLITFVSEADNLIDLRKDGLFDYDDIIYVGEVTKYVRSLKE